LLVPHPVVLDDTIPGTRLPAFAPRTLEPTSSLMARSSAFEGKPQPVSRATPANASASRPRKAAASAYPLYFFYVFCLLRFEVRNFTRAAPASASGSLRDAISFVGGPLRFTPHRNEHGRPTTAACGWGWEV